MKRLALYLPRIALMALIALALLAPQQKAQAFKEVFPYAKIQDPNPAANAIKDSLDATINDMLNGKISPEDAQKKIKSEADKALKQFNP